MSSSVHNFTRRIMSCISAMHGITFELIKRLYQFKKREFLWSVGWSGGGQGGCGPFGGPLGGLGVGHHVQWVGEMGGLGVGLGGGQCS